jgi:hypothetical protein
MVRYQEATPTRPQAGDEVDWSRLSALPAIQERLISEVPRSRHYPVLINCTGLHHCVGITPKEVAS